MFAPYGPSHPYWAYGFGRNDTLPRMYSLKISLLVYISYVEILSIFLLLL